METIFCNKRVKVDTKIIALNVALKIAIMVNLPYINRNFDISKQMSVVNFSGVLNILKARK